MVAFKAKLPPEEMFNPSNKEMVEDAWLYFVNMMSSSKLVETEIDLEKKLLAMSIKNVQKFVKEDAFKILDIKPDIDLILVKFIRFL